MKNRNWFWGLLFIACAAVLIAQGLNYTSINVWTIVLTVLFAASIIDSLPRLNWFGIFVPLGLIYILFAKELNQLWNVPVLQWYYVLGAMVLLSIGFSILFKRRNAYIYMNRTRASQKKMGDTADDFDEKIIDIEGDEDTDDFDESLNSNWNSSAHHGADGRIVKFSSKLTDTIRYVYSDNLESAFLANSMGSLKVYFDQAHLNENQAVVHVNCSLGDMSLYFPKEWIIIDEIRVSLGNVSNRFNQKIVPAADAPRVIIKGSVSMGDISIYYV